MGCGAGGRRSLRIAARRARGAGHATDRDGLCTAWSRHLTDRSLPSKRGSAGRWDGPRNPSSVPTHCAPRSFSVPSACCVGYKPPAEEFRVPAWWYMRPTAGRSARVTSGTFSPTLKIGIALALITSGLANDDVVTVDIRGRQEPFVITKPPFVTPGVREV